MIWRRVFRRGEQIPFVGGSPGFPEMLFFGSPLKGHWRWNVVFGLARSFAFPLCSVFLFLFSTGAILHAEVLPHNTTCAESLGRRACEAISKGNLQRGKVLLQSAIAANPSDEGQNYRCIGLLDVNAAAFRRGEEQLLRMLRDRPQMRVHLDEDGDLWRWACTAFAGSESWLPVEWDPTLPTGGVADSTIGTNGQKSRIRLFRRGFRVFSRETDQDFEFMWSLAVFELHNIRQGGQCERLHARLRCGCISKSSFVEAMYATEFAALQMTRAFYAQLFLPWAAKHDLKTNPHFWSVDGPWGSSKQHFEAIQQHDQYPWNTFGPYYDKVAMWYVNGLENLPRNELNVKHIQAVETFALRDSSIAGVLVRALASPDPTVVNAAKTAIEHLDVKEEALQNCIILGLESTRPFEAIQCARVLRLNSAKIIEGLNAIVGDTSRDASIRREAQSTLQVLTHSRREATRTTPERTDGPKRRAGEGREGKR